MSKSQNPSTPRGEGKKRFIKPPPLPPDLLQYAREMRAECTDAELLLWRILRNRQLEGFKFRRQHPVGRYILDFYCHEAKLAVELDGGDHDLEDQAACDAGRDQGLGEAGIRVLRFWNTDVSQNLQGVLEEIYGELLSRSPSPPPSPTGRGSRGCS